MLNHVAAQYRSIRSNDVWLFIILTVKFIVPRRFGRLSMNCIVLKIRRDVSVSSREGKTKSNGNKEKSKSEFN